MGRARNIRMAIAAGAALITAVFVFSGFAISARAQQTPSPDATSIKVQPALFEQVVNPGDRFSTSITVTNANAAAREFTVSVADISNLTSNGQPVFSASSVPEYGLSEWVSISKPVITVPANGSVVVPFTVNVPSYAVPGGHYAAIFVTLGAKRPNLTGTGIGYQVGSLLDFRIAGDAKETAEIREFSTDKGLYQSPSVTFKATIADTGNVLLRPRGPIDITNMFGQKVGTIVMNDANAGIFPGQERSFTANWNGGGFMMGRFDAVLALSYGTDAQKTISQQTSFWVIPVGPILIVIASILFFILIFVWAVRAYIRKKVAAMAGGHQGGGSLTAEERFLAENRMPFSRLLFILIITAVFTIIFLIILLFLFG